MTRGEIIAAWNAQEDDENSWHHLGEDEKLEWATKLEREACAKVCEELQSPPDWNLVAVLWKECRSKLASAIRARGEN